MRKYYGFIIVLLLLVFITSCKKEKVEPIDQLPAATQEGKNTLGFLVNGKAWTPEGNNGTRNLFIRYNPNGSGSFDLTAYRMLKDGTDEGLYFYVTNFNNQQSFILNNLSTGAVLFDNSNCYFDRDPKIYRKGTLTITKFDLPNQIIAGTFEAVLAKPGCDTIKITDGRFDMKF